MNIARLLDRAARSYGGLPAVAVGTAIELSYAELGARTRAIAGGLRRDLGLQPGDRVAIAMKNCPPYFEIQNAIWQAGLVAVPVNAGLHPREIRYILDNSGARVCFASAEIGEAVRPFIDELDHLDTVVCPGESAYGDLLEAPHMDAQEVAETDAAWLFYTSGTTGRPKGATLTHRNLLIMTLSYYADIDAVVPGETIIHAAPLSHGSGLYGLPFLAKGGVGVIPESGGFAPDEIFALTAAWRNVSFFAVPTIVTRLVNARESAAAETANLKTIVYGGAPMYVEDLKRALDLFGPKLVQIYGQGETPMTATALGKTHHADTGNPRYLDHLASTGISRTDVEVRVVDESDRALAAGEIGEVLVRGDVVMKGYWENPEATAETLRGGWLHTGDLGVMDDEGFLTLKDRSKDMIISGGVNVYPREIEEVLLRHTGVLECSVIGRAHPEWGEEVVAFIVAQPDTGVSEDELDRLCLDNVARFKRPRAYFFLDRLPKSNYGKILKTTLRERLDAEAARAG